MLARRLGRDDAWRTRRRWGIATGLIAAAFLAALVVYTQQGYAIRGVYWTLRRVAADLLG